MFSIPLPHGDNSLLLSLPGTDLPGWQRIGLLVLVAILCLVPFVLIGWLYRYELHLVRRMTALRLLGLRLVLLVVLLGIVCLQPIVGHSTLLERPGRVLIALDRSASMDTTDPQRTPLEKLRLARFLHLCTDQQFEDWSRRYDPRTGQMRWVGSEESGSDEAKRRLAEERRRPFEDVCRQVDTRTRTQIARNLLGPEGAGLLQALRARHEVELLGFDREAWEVAPDRVGELFQPRDPGPNAPTRGTAALPNRFFTDLNQPLLHAAADRGRFLGVVLLTDGRHNTGTLPDQKARELGERRVPIYPIVLGAQRSPPDLAMTRVEAPAAAREGVEVQVTAHVRVRGLDRQKIAVTVRRPDAPPDQPPLAQATVQHSGEDGSYDVPVLLRLDRPGRQTYLVTAQPAAAVKGMRTDNNSRPVAIQVGGDYKPKVLLVDDEARWEYHYLTSALLRDPSLRVERVLFEPPLLNPNDPDDLLQQLGNPRRTLPAGPDALRAYDCIVLGDVDPRHLPPAERERLEKYVKDAGKTLLLLAGKRFLPMAYMEETRQGPKDADPLVKLLPIQSPRVLDRKEGFRRRPTEAGQATPFLQLGENPAESERLWDRLPPHYWAVTGQAKPAATPLAYWPDEERAWQDLVRRVTDHWPGSAAAVNGVPQGHDQELTDAVRRQQQPEIDRFAREVEQFAEAEWKLRRASGTDVDRAWKEVLDRVEANWPALKDARLGQVAAGKLADLAERVRQQRAHEIEQLVQAEQVRVRRRQEREQPLIVRQNYGLGRVLFIGLDSTWRWRYKVGDRYHHRFWSQVLHWAASDKPPIRFGTGQVVYAPGQDVDLFLRLEEEAVQSWPADAQVTARVVRLTGEGKPGEAVAVVRLTGDVKDRQLTGRLRDLPAGTYAVELAVSDPALAARLLGPAARDPKGARRAAFAVVPPESVELMDLAADGDQLQRLAGESHGKVLAPEDAAELLTLLTPRPAVRVDHPEYRLWQWWPTLALVLLLLTVEWVGRKLAGLP
jgi:hypothetical protein